MKYFKLVCFLFQNLFSKDFDAISMHDANDKDLESSYIFERDLLKFALQVASGMVGI